MKLIVENIAQWHRDRNLIDGSTDKDQYMKLIQEAGELSDNICKGKDIRDDIANVDINTLTPVEALMKLSEIKKKLG